ncbi:MAG: LLM class F420-dependent oxidoreductase [Chloroflexi bacterium GWB2_54_36]|nr:MAG: LLM class F420-dependent oxidoreductase [Chloroflexi bacterium GWB2_54_36]
MVDLAIMVEGQNGLNWTRWQRLVKQVEELGFYGLFRSDHFTNSRPPDLDSLELWTSLTWLAGNTRRIRFGPLVTPVSFRHPALTARMAAAVDDLSGGRLTLGLGAGWQEREHQLYGFDLLPPAERFDRFEEGIQIVQQLLNQNEPVSFVGKYFELQKAALLPRPQRPGGPPILIGGNGKGRTLRLAARYADEWNAIYLKPEEYRRLNGRLDEFILVEGREPNMVRRSMMTGLVFGADQAAFDRRVAGEGNSSVEELKERGMIVGTPSAVIDQIGALADAGVQGLMLQWLDLDDLAGLEALAKTVMGKV